MKRIYWAVAFLAVLAGGGVAYQTYILAPAPSQPAAAPQARQAPAVPVLVVPVVRQATPVRLDAIGSVQTISSIAIKARLDGVIERAMIHDGQYVHKGDVLFLLDARAAEAQMHQAEAQLARDRAQLTYAELEVKRFAPLEQKSFISREQFDQAQSNEAALTAAVAADQAALENFKVLLTYYTIRSPIDGRVGLITLKDGNNVKANDVPFVTINQIEPIYVTFSVPQHELPGIRAALAAGAVEVSAQLPGDKGPPVKGRIEFFENTVDTGTGTISLKAIFANKEERLWPGQFVNVSVALRVDPDALVVPQAAVQIGQKDSFVFVAKPDNTAEFRRVTVARTIDGKSVIAEGLSEGDRVVVDGQLRLSNGARLDIRAAKDQPPPADQAAKAGARS